MLTVYNDKDKWISFFPKTGDDSNPVVYVAGMAIFGLLFAFLMVYENKKKKEIKE